MATASGLMTPTDQEHFNLEIEPGLSGLHQGDARSLPEQLDTMTSVVTAALTSRSGFGKLAWV